MQMPGRSPRKEVSTVFSASVPPVEAPSKMILRAGKDRRRGRAFAVHWRWAAGQQSGFLRARPQPGAGGRPDSFGQTGAVGVGGIGAARLFHDIHRPGLQGLHAP